MNYKWIETDNGFVDITQAYFFSFGSDFNDGNKISVYAHFAGDEGGICLNTFDNKDQAKVWLKFLLDDLSIQQGDLPAAPKRQHNEGGNYKRGTKWW